MKMLIPCNDQYVKDTSTYKGLLPVRLTNILRTNIFTGTFRNVEFAKNINI